MTINLALLLIIIHGFTTLILSKSIFNTNNNSLSTTKPLFAARILDHNNNDITSSFQILLYSQNIRGHATPSPNSTSLPHHRRRVLNRLLNGCPNLQQFVSSHCTPVDNTPGSLQAYTVVCRHGPMGGAPVPRARNAISRRQGSCEPHEICVDTTSQIAPSNPRYQEEGDGPYTITVPTATCVTDDAFEPSDGFSETGVAEFWAAAFGLTGDAPSLVRAALSRYDKTTPLEADRLVIEGDDSSSSSGKQEQAICRDCVGLGMKVEGSLDGLKVEARLLTTVQMGLTGVLWLAAMSGR